MIRPKTNSTIWILLGFLSWVVMTPISASATTLTATISATSDYEAYLSISGIVPGSLFLDSSQIAESPGTGEIELQTGVIHYLHIKVKAGSDFPSSFIGTFVLSDLGFIFPNLNTIISTNSTHWIVSREGFGVKHAYLANLGVNGTNPWGTVSELDPLASYLWSEVDAGDHYFSIAILPTDSTSRRFTVGVQPEFNSIEGILTQTQGVPYQLSYQDGPSRGLGIAYPGRIGARSEETLVQGPGDLYTASWAGYDSPDYILTTTGSETSADISLNFMVNGNMQGGAGKGGLPVEVSTASSLVDVYVQINNESLYFIRGTLTARHEVGTETPGTEVTVSDLFGRDLFPADVTGDAGDFMAEYNVTIDKLFTTSAYTIQVGVPFSVKMDNQVLSTAKSDLGHAASKIDFTGGVSFPTTGNVFNVPAGFTVNSISGRVADNKFEGPVEPAEVFAEGMFLQLPDVEGESNAKGREGWIDLVSISSGISRSRGGYLTLPPLLGDVVVTKYLDKSSPKLAEALSNGRLFDDVVVETNQVLPGDRYSNFQYRLNGAIVTAYRLASDPSESVPL
ncbi:MAG: type VI secretion system tube protein Hcp [Verrucomicrobia bacterium]|nr:type VI secretion system tube protein Hcp [Verrucomicrobiota bacterium]MDA1069011.1 type VI secretion system tube protein Hcp [Verrucomicrobiota bacterium]